MTQFVARSSSARELTPGYDWDGVHLIVVVNDPLPRFRALSVV
jgi:hypothetical protein